MPVYEWSCRCGEESSTVRSMSSNTTDKNCPTCGEAMNRRFTPPATKLDLHPHFNYALGRYVNSRRDLEDGFKAASEAASRRTGTEHRFVPTDPQEHRQGDEGTEEQDKAHRDLRLTESKKTLFT